MVNILNSRQIHWKNTGLVWAMVLPGGVLNGNQETLQPGWGSLAGWREQSCAHHHVLALDSRERWFPADH
ncbi:hypothetical protein LAD67_12515 [Escherichia coli]|nr:hypothetical protein [Escherichia coli]